MPETIEPPVAPATVTAPPSPPSSATSGTPVAESTSGSASLVDEMNALIDAPAKPAETKTDRERGEDGKFKPVEKPVEPVKPVEKPKEAPKEPAALRKRLSELEGQLNQTKAEKQAELDKLQGKISELEKRRYLTPEQEQRQQQMERRAKELEGELIARDYRKSPEYKRDFEDKWQSTWQDAVGDVSQLQTTDPTTNEPRMATQADFEKIRLAGSRVQQRTMARAMFPEDYDLVLGHINTLNGIQTQAADAVARKQASYETEQHAESQTYQSRYSEVDASLVAKYPNFFGDDPELPEARAEMEKGLDYVDKAMEQSANAPASERAALAATIRRWAGSFPRMVYTLNKKNEMIAELNERLAKFEASDPGAGGNNPPPTPTTKSSGGVDAMAAEFDKLG